MDAKIIAEKCIGCGLCVQLAPSVYHMQEDKAVVKVLPVAEDQAENAKSAAEACPVAAIEIS